MKRYLLVAALLILPGCTIWERLTTHRDPETGNTPVADAGRAVLNQDWAGVADIVFYALFGTSVLGNGYQARRVAKLKNGLKT